MICEVYMGSSRCRYDLNTVNATMTATSSQ